LAKLPVFTVFGKKTAGKLAHFPRDQAIPEIKNKLFGKIK